MPGSYCRILEVTAPAGPLTTYALHISDMILVYGLTQNYIIGINVSLFLLFTTKLKPILV